VGHAIAELFEKMMTHKWVAKSLKFGGERQIKLNRIKKAKEKYVYCLHLKRDQMKMTFAWS